jgi:hypothetical protein
MNETEVRILRHLLATLAYRGGKAIRGAQPSFADFQPEGAKNTPLALLSHISDLVEWAHRWTMQATGAAPEYRTAQPKTWREDTGRFHDALASFDKHLASGAAIPDILDSLLQAPIADAFTHIGQIALLRRLSGDPVAGEAFRLAPIEIGRLGREQGPPGREFALDKGAVWTSDHA